MRTIKLSSVHDGGRGRLILMGVVYGCGHLLPETTQNNCASQI